MVLVFFLETPAPAQYLLEFYQPEPFEAGVQLSRPALQTRTLQSVPDTLDTERELIQARRRRIVEAFEADQIVEAFELIQAGLRIFENNPDLILLAAQLHSTLREFEPAEPYWRRYLQIAPDSIYGWTSLGMVLIRLNRIAEAEEVLVQAQDLDPYYAPMSFNLMLVHLMRGRVAEANAVLRPLGISDLRAMAFWMTNPDDLYLASLDPQIWGAMADVVLRGGYRSGESDPAAAVDQMRIRLSRMLEIIDRLGDLIEAENWSVAAQVVKHPRIAQLGFSAPVFVAYGHYLSAKADDREAVNELRNMVQEHEDYLHVALRLVYWWMEQENFGESLRLLDRLDRQFPGNPIVRMLTASATAQRGNHQEALALLEQLGPRDRAIARSWFSARTPYQQTILRHPDFELWRLLYLGDR
jgi:tetratricopeptide (TPR) repeat protein